MAEKKVVVEPVYGVYCGKQVIFSSEDKKACESVASRKVAESLNLGNDIRIPEHKIEVRVI